MWRLILICLLVSLVGCTNVDIKFPPEPKMDQSTPDNLVKSLWAHDNWVSRCSYLETLKYSKESTLFAPKVLQQTISQIETELAKPSDRDDNKIENVEIQSQSRAIVLTSETRYDNDKEPTTIKYILTSDTKKWFVEDIIVICRICEGTGKTKDNEKELSNLKAGIWENVPEITCSSCKGKGWKSYIYD
jgi:hypothetical protein